MSKDSAPDPRLIGCVVALTNVLEVGRDYMRHARTTGPEAVALAGALNGAESALKTLQREQPNLFRKGA